MTFKYYALVVFVLGFFVGKPVAAGDLDFSKAIKVGSGPKTVIEFTDPDCPFCRKASKYFDARSDVTRYVFFNPLARHPRAKEKVRYVLSQSDRARAYREIMSGRMDATASLPSSPEGVRLQEEQFEIAKKSKVDSTPTFLINGRIIEGFDLKKLEEILGPKP
jgi:thiol:disulfide interchange protein DsbC